jgi:YD repeat-containing protein
MTDAEQHTTRYEYDSLGRRSDTYLPLNQQSSHTYDEVGNLKTSTDFNRKTIVSSPKNNLAQSLYPSSPVQKKLILI